MTTAAIETRPAVSAALLARRLRDEHLLFLPGDTLGAMLALRPDAVEDFAAYWPGLTLDRYMGDGGRYRLRRYGEFDAQPGAARRLLPHAPYEQPAYINSLNGGIARIFDPLEPGFAAHPVLDRVLDWLTKLVDHCEGHAQRWNIRLHPYRILARQDEPGRPTPEGLHRDGVDYIVSLLMTRHNVVGGATTVTDNAGRVLWHRTLQRPLDIMVGSDARTLHAVSPLAPIDSSLPAWRDVLVIAFSKVPA